MEKWLEDRTNIVLRNFVVPKRRGKIFFSRWRFYLLPFDGTSSIRKERKEFSTKNSKEQYNKNLLNVGGNSSNNWIPISSVPLWRRYIFENNFKLRRVNFKGVRAPINPLNHASSEWSYTWRNYQVTFPENIELSARKLYDPISIYAFAQKSSPTQTRRNFHHNLHKRDVFSSSRGGVALQLLAEIFQYL